MNERERVAFKLGYKQGAEHALQVFKKLQEEYQFKIDDKEFFVELGELLDEIT